MAVPADDMAELQPLMQSVAASSKELKAHLDAGKGDEAAAKAAEISEHSKKMQKWWAAKGKKDAAKWSRDMAKTAKQIQGMAKSGDTAGAAGHFKTMTGNCASCHQAYRGKDADGKWTIKL
jgi:cytochrome c556